MICWQDSKPLSFPEFCPLMNIYYLVHVHNLKMCCYMRYTVLASIYFYLFKMLVFILKYFIRSPLFCLLSSKQRKVLLTNSALEQCHIDLLSKDYELQKWGILKWCNVICHSFTDTMLTMPRPQCKHYKQQIISHIIDKR